MSTQVPENMKDILDEITSYVYLTNFMLPDRSNLGDHISSGIWYPSRVARSCKKFGWRGQYPAIYVFLRRHVVYEENA